MTILYKTIIVIAIASVVIFFYSFKIKKGSAHLEEEKSELKEKENGEWKGRNSELTTENPQLESITKENSELNKETPKLKEKIQKLEEKNTKLNEKKPEKKENNSESQNEFCEPKTNILFLKTHKTASTTLLKLFHRFAYRNQLTVTMKVNPLKIIKKFDRCSIYPLKPGNEYNIFARHTIFNYEEMKDIMPADTTFLTILRDAAAQFESAYSFFKFDNLYGMNITTFADLDTSFPKWSRIKNLRHNGNPGRNSNAYDLGLDPELFDDEEAILQKVQELDQQFDLVMINELFNESMILMKKKLCWKEFSDVASIKRNTRRADVKVRLSSEQKEKLREKNRADQMIYDHFYQKLLRQVHAFGKEKMEEEVKKLRALTEEIDEVCVDHESNGTFNDLRGTEETRFKVGAEKHKVCQAIIKYEKSANWKKFSKSKFAKAIECED